MRRPEPTPLRVGVNSPDTVARRVQLERIHTIERMTERQRTLRIIYLEDQLEQAQQRLSEYSWRDNPGQGSH